MNLHNGHILRDPTTHEHKLLAAKPHPSGDPVANAHAHGIGIAARTWALEQTGLNVAIFVRRQSTGGYMRELAPLRALVWAKMHEYRVGGLGPSWPDIAAATGCPGHATPFSAVKNLRAAQARAKESMR